MAFIVSSYKKAVVNAIGKGFFFTSLKLSVDWCNVYGFAPAISNPGRLWLWLWLCSNT
jgi:hypothetical protein